MISTVLLSWAFRPTWILVPLLIVAVLLTLLYVFQDRLIFYPQSITEDEAEAVTERYDYVSEVSYQVDDEKHVHGWLIEPQTERGKSEGLLIYYGGNAEELSAQIPEMSAELASWSVLLVNYRGYGLSDGAPSEEALYNDALMIFDDIKRRMDPEPPQTVLMGRSIGTGVAVKVASERPVDGTILISPFDSLKEVGRQHYPFLPVGALLRYDFSSAERINAVGSPILTVSGSDDSIIPKERTQKLIEKIGLPHRHEEIAGRGHNDLHLDAKYWETIHEFLDAE
ncbi:alpha/beta hydrolase [Salisediminibacterium halotolerans]|uniref:Serine aminopeptidase S33 domain-containing protein n=1 Tax=Salisediminibacterium halotolerans TaxID=517425 RepID=A0A1H9T8U7_9BACI|nr:alpha/beta hydrolase [Salisediminibacterium haloalkalitolerans]SER93581.1 hypothetical protein SAMN05444126_10940 [Salisediminibacterium haloalkalitolerans]